MATQQEKTKRITKATVLEFAANYYTSLEDIEMNTFVIKCYNWILGKSDTYDGNTKAKYALEYALRAYSIPPLIYKEEPTIEKVFELAEEFYLWATEVAKEDKDLSITMNTAIDRTLKLMVNDIIQMESLEEILLKIKTYYKWMIS